MTKHTDYDSPWKEIVDLFFSDFMAFFYPDIYADIDWSRGYKFLDKELQQVVREAVVTGRRVDKLVQVWRKDGSEIWVLIHIEIQGTREDNFEERMYIYNYRLFDRYHHKVVSLAILTDENRSWRPSSYGYQLWNTRVQLDFGMIKLLDYKEFWSQLEKDKNPFAVVVMAHLQTQATQDEPIARHQAKLTLAKMLYRRGYTREQILELFRFINWIMVLPEYLDQQLENELEQYEDELQMRYVTTIERRAEARGLEKGLEEGLEKGLEKGLEEGLEKGLEKGLEEGLEKGLEEGYQGGVRDLIMYLLHGKFETISAELLTDLNQVIGKEPLQKLFDLALSVESPDIFHEAVRNTVVSQDSTT